MSLALELLLIDQVCGARCYLLRDSLVSFGIQSASPSWSSFATSGDRLQWLFVRAQRGCFDSLDDAFGAIFVRLAVLLRLKAFHVGLTYTVAFFLRG